MLIGDRTSGSLSPSIQQTASSQLPPAYQNPDARRSADINSRPESRPASGSITGQPYLRTSASAQPFPTGNPFFEPIISPARSTSFIPNTVNESPAGPSFLPPNTPSGPQNFPVSHSTNYPNGGFPPSRPPSESSIGSGVRKMPSAHSLNTQYFKPTPLPSFPSGYHQPHGPNQIPWNNLHAPQPRPTLPSQFGPRSVSIVETSFNEPSPPNSPVQQPQDLGPVVSTISAQMKCKVFLQQQHAQWKSLGSAKLKLYRQNPTNIKQLVVEADRDRSILISTIVLTDGVERVLPLN
jgi:hypothetical protein